MQFDGNRGPVLLHGSSSAASPEEVVYTAVLKHKEDINRESDGVHKQANNAHGNVDFVDRGVCAQRWVCGHGR